MLERLHEVAPFVLLVCACGAAVRSTAAPQPPPLPDILAAPDDSMAFESLAARRPNVAPGMHEIARRESGGEPVDLARADGRDACVRVAFVASAPVDARLVDGTGNVLAASGEPVTDGALGAKGPVCIRRGDVVKGVVVGTGARVRWMAWEAP